MNLWDGDWPSALRCALMVCEACNLLIVEVELVSWLICGKEWLKRYHCLNSRQHLALLALQMLLTCIYQSAYKQAREIKAFTYKTTAWEDRANEIVLQQELLVWKMGASQSWSVQAPELGRCFTVNFDLLEAAIVKAWQPLGRACRVLETYLIRNIAPGIFRSTF